MKQAAVSHKAEKKVNVLLNVALSYAIRLWARLYFMGFVFSLLPVYRNDGYWFINDLTNRHDLLSDLVAVIRRKNCHCS